MRKHKLIELRKIIEEKIGSLTEEVEIATHVKLNPLYIADRKEEIEFLHWTATVINSDRTLIENSRTWNYQNTIGVN